MSRRDCRWALLRQGRAARVRRRATRSSLPRQALIALNRQRFGRYNAPEEVISKYNTNLAAEFFVLSMLHRLGFDATITLGSKKSVDIVVTLRTGRAITIDVKGLAGKTGWPVDNLRRGSSGHFIVFVCFLGRIDDHSILPEVYVVPSTSVRPLVYNAPGGRKVVPLSRIRSSGSKFREAWTLLKRSAA